MGYHHDDFLLALKMDSIKETLSLGQAGCMDWTQMILVIIKKRIPCTHQLTKFGDNTEDLERRKNNFQILKEEGIEQNIEKKIHISSQGKYLSTLHI